jgi:hypothetical protein
MGLLQLKRLMLSRNTALSLPPSVSFDSNALAYISAVETADGQALETGVRNAINAFVVGCKADGTWNAIKASCILSGARTLSGALVPLVGTAPTNNNFVSGDYNRKTGLIGNASTKYLDSNRNTNADPQDNYSFCVYISTAGTIANAIQLYLGGLSATGGTYLGLYLPSLQLFFRNRNIANDFAAISTSTATGLIGSTRNTGTNYVTRISGNNTTITTSSQTPANGSTHIFAEFGSSSYRSDARMAFYSIGESLNLTLLNTRITTLINAFAAAIP